MVAHKDLVVLRSSDSQVEDDDPRLIITGSIQGLCNVSTHTTCDVPKQSLYITIADIAEGQGISLQLSRWPDCTSRKIITFDERKYRLVAHPG
jgi:hypothetical protein